MKRILIYIFCYYITAQSMIGQFVLLNIPNDSLITPFSITEMVPLGKVGDKDQSLKINNKVPEERGQSHHSKIILDLIADHLFSPSNSHSEVSQWNLSQYYLYLGSSLNVYKIQEKINNFLVLYSEICKIIQIGLPLQKLLYPFHNFY